MSDQKVSELSFSTAPTIGIAQTKPGSISFCMGGNAALVTIRPDGTIEYGEGYTPDTAAKAFWDAMGYERTQREPRK